MELTDAPTSFIYAGTLFIMSAIYGPFVKPALKYFTTARPKLWTMLIGHTGVARKTSTIRLVGEILRAVLPAECFLPCDFTQEGFLDMLRTEEGEPVFKDKPGIIFVDEFGGFLRAVREKKYLAGLTNFINCLYDEAPFARRLRSGRIDVPAGNYILMMAGLTTPISKYMSLEDFKSGFANRFMLVYGERERFTPSFPTEDEELAQVMGQDAGRSILEECVDVVRKRYAWIKKLHEANGYQPLEVYPLDREVRERLRRIERNFDSWTRKRLRQDPEHVEAIYTTRFFSHFRTVLTFMAVDKPVLQPNRKTPLFVIDQRHVESLLTESEAGYVGFFRDLTKPALDLLVEEYMTPGRRRLEEKVESYIKQFNRERGLVSRDDLYKRFRLPVEDLTRVLSSLAKIGRIIAFKKGKGRYYWHVDSGEPPVGDEYRRLPEGVV